MGRKKIMITGAAGGIGKVLKVGLKKWYRLRLLYHQNILPAESDEEVCLGSITDLSKMIEVSAGVNAVVHLAGDPWEDSSFEEVLKPNIVGTYTIFEACRQAGVGRIIYASSNHVTGYYEIERTYTTPEMPVRPDGYYGVSKVFGEALAPADQKSTSPTGMTTGYSPPGSAIAIWFSWCGEASRQKQSDSVSTMASQAIPGPTGILKMPAKRSDIRRRTMRKHTPDDMDR
jgi:uronate dehydrogenase